MEIGNETRSLPRAGRGVHGDGRSLPQGERDQEERRLGTRPGVKEIGNGTWFSGTYLYQYMILRRAFIFLAVVFQ